MIIDRDTVVTAKMLKRLGACSDQVLKFQALFPEGTKVTCELCVKHASVFDWNWAASNLLNATLRADYYAKHAPLPADYDAKHASLWADYDAKHASLWADYNAKRASLWADYNAKRASLFADIFRG